ncbi:hypothetical protein C9374_008017 [Naegleria lovaniensis]|uniref:Uncharacterized protein n=1 Tax=Naegleria lovaniensis TaxID=51637 RepID=A0AA88KLG1_NAELO|nr:uncharacterized protein C9374_008017 [Naegleria lovaniensis]KAG2378869.1 hypothetical protein C9374_008017 [Naegleria lovaniensis]
MHPYARSLQSNQQNRLSSSSNALSNNLAGSQQQYISPYALPLPPPTTTSSDRFIPTENPFGDGNHPSTYNPNVVYHDQQDNNNTPLGYNPNYIQDSTSHSPPPQVPYSIPPSNNIHSQIIPCLAKGEQPSFQYFGIGPHCCWELLIWILSKLTFGFAEAFVALNMYRGQVTEMVIAGRRLEFDLSDPFLKVPILCIINNFINDFTFGLWYFSGMMHLFYYSEFDRRISWGEVVDPNEASKVVWHPNDSGKGQFKIFSAYPGIFTEAMTWICRLLSATFLLGFAEPWIKSYYYKALMPNMEFGGLGSFAPSNVKPGFGREKLKVNFSASGSKMFFRFLQGHILVVLSLGTFLCCFGNWIDAFMNRYITVDESAAPSLSAFRIKDEQADDTYYVHEYHEHHRDSKI